MNKNKFELMKKCFSLYSKTIKNSILNAFCFGLIFSAFTAIHKISEIKAGEFPGQSRDIINKQLNQVLPNIIVESVIKCLLIMIIFFIPILIYRFKVENKISLIREFKTYFGEKIDKIRKWRFFLYSIVIVLLAGITLFILLIINAKNDVCIDTIHSFIEAVNSKDTDLYISLFNEDIQNEMRDYIKDVGTETFFVEDKRTLVSISKADGRVALDEKELTVLSAQEYELRFHAFLYSQIHIPKHPV